MNSRWHYNQQSREYSLLNILAFHGYEHLVVIAICDCSKHMSEGSIKDAEYIADLFKHNVQ